MRPGAVTERGRALAEHAVELKPKQLVGDLLVLRRVDDAERFVFEAVNVSRSLRVSYLGLALTHHSRLVEAVAMSLTGVVVVRVAHGSRFVVPLPGDAALALDRLRELGLDWASPP